MSKAQKITYWISTVWLCLGMTSTGIVQIMHLPDETKMITKLGYPEYFMTVIGVWKLLGVIAVLLPKTALLKEWAYAGFFFTMSGAIASHLANAEVFTTILPPALLLVLTCISWYTRPESRKTH